MPPISAILNTLLPASQLSAPEPNDKCRQFDRQSGAANRVDIDMVPAAIYLQQEHIAHISDDTTRHPLPIVDTAILDAEGCVVLPGLIDVHVHGAAGYDTMDATPDALAEMARFFAAHGVTGFLATTITAPHQETIEAVRAVQTYTENPVSGARILGVHLEGPYISTHYPGMHLVENIRPPALAEFSELIEAGPVRMITLAPEVGGADELIHAACAHNVVVVAGHTNATYAECMAGFEAGIAQATHTYNAMRGLHHREPGTLGAILSHPTIDAQIITDNIHVHPAAINILARCKGVERTVIITDAMRATGLENGEYHFGGQTVYARDGECRLADGTLAGSVITMECALANFIAATGLTLAEAWPASSVVPARTLGLDKQMGQLRPGYLADMVLLDEQLAVVATVVGGDVVYLREPERLRKL